MLTSIYFLYILGKEAYFKALLLLQQLLLLLYRVDMFNTPLVLVQFIILVSRLISDLSQQAQECLYTNSVRTIATSVIILVRQLVSDPCHYDLEEKGMSLREA